MLRSRSLLLSRKVGLQGAPGEELVLRLPSRRNALLFPLGDRGLTQAKRFRGLDLRPVEIDQFGEFHAQIIGIPFWCVKRYSDIFLR